MCGLCARPCGMYQDEDFLVCNTCLRATYCSNICRHADWISQHKRNCAKRRPTAMYINLDVGVP